MTDDWRRPTPSGSSGSPLPPPPATTPGRGPTRPGGSVRGSSGRAGGRRRWPPRRRRSPRSGRRRAGPARPARSRRVRSRRSTSTPSTASGCAGSPISSRHGFTLKIGERPDGGGTTGSSSAHPDWARPPAGEQRLDTVAHGLRARGCAGGRLPRSRVEPRGRSASPSRSSTLTSASRGSSSWFTCRPTIASESPTGYSSTSAPSRRIVPTSAAAARAPARRWSRRSRRASGSKVGPWTSVEVSTTKNTMLKNESPSGSPRSPGRWRARSAPRRAARPSPPSADSRRFKRARRSRSPPPAAAPRTSARRRSGAPRPRCPHHRRVHQEAHDRGLPRRARLGEPDRAVPHARPAREPQRLRRHRRRGAAGVRRPDLRRAAAGRAHLRRCRSASTCERPPCSAGPGCAAACRSCSPPSR